MSTNSFSPDMSLPPPGTNWISVIQPTLAFLLIGFVLSTLLIPLLIALVALSTPASRKHAVFSLNVVAISLGMIAAIVHSYVMIHEILSPSDPLSGSINVAFTIIMTFTPLVVESILLLRLVAVFPPRETPLAKFIANLTIPVASKVIRLILLGLFCQCYITGVCSISSTSAEIADNDVRWAILYVKTTWFLQIIDNTYVTSMFLWQLRKQAIIFHRYSSWSLQARLTGLFYIALTTYIVPLILGIVELILIFAAHSFVPATCVLFFDIYISIFGVAFATVWTTGINWIDQANSLTISAGTTIKTHTAGFTQNSMSSDRTTVGGAYRSRGESLAPLAPVSTDKEYIQDSDIALDVLIKHSVDPDVV